MMTSSSSQISAQFDDYASTVNTSELVSLQPVSTSFSVRSHTDARVTSKREIIGWLSFSFGSEPFVVAAVAVYLPILLEQYARDNSVLAEDHSKHCYANGQTAIPSPESFSSTARPGQCVMPVMGGYIDPASFALYTFSISVCLQALVVVSMSGAADRGSFRKLILVGFSIVGAIAVLLFIAVPSRAYYLASILTIISNASFGAVAVCGNAFLPVLVRSHPDVLSSFDYQALNSDHISNSQAAASSSAVDANFANDDENSNKSSSNARAENAHESFESFPAETVDPEARPYFDFDLSNYQLEKVEQVSGQLSGLGTACGYLSAFIVQIIGIAIISAMGSTVFSLRVVLMLIGIWWLIFTVPVALFMRPRPGPVLHLEPSQNAFVHYVLYGWRTLAKTARQVRHLRDVGMYLAGWFILSDCSTTINSTSILFARTELQMSPPALAFLGIDIMVFGIVGAIFFSRWAPKYLNISPNKIVSLLVAITAIVPAYALVGFISMSIGVHHPWELYVLAALYGACLGGMSSYCRSVFSLLIPPGKESTFFALYAVTDKGSSIVGPTVTALITDRTHNIRYTFYFLFLFLLLAVPIFYYIDIDRGKRDAERFNELVDPDE
ncbi:autophagy-related protein 22-like protein [Lipomyces oligophaga]|uniref:autophagy-related protein 22-like protein n=1 Tax=Lipomyces oligophaga TaxID=45792 RepID=UPI0034CF72CF